MNHLSEEERNARTAREFFNVVYNQRRPDRMGEFAHSDGVAYQTAGIMVGRQSVRENVVERFLDAFPDLSIDLDDVIAAADQAVIRWVARGTHRGWGLGIAPTEEAITLHGMSWLVFRDGRIIKGWDCYDHGGMLARLLKAAQRSSE